jgi:homoserine kinase
MEVATRAARQMLSATVTLGDVVWQHANLAGFVAGCFAGDVGLIRTSLEDVVIEPQRKVLIPNFDRIKRAAMAMGALGCSISGAGPSLFAWCEARDAEAVRAAIVGEFESSGLVADSWITRIEGPGARVVKQS